MDTRTSLNVKIDPMIHCLAFYRAKENGMELAEFVGLLLNKCLVEGVAESLLYPDPSERRSVLGLEFLWNDDEATRLYNVATYNPGWLSRSQTKLFAEYSAERARAKKQPGAKSFREFYHRKEK